MKRDVGAGRGKRNRKQILSKETNSRWINSSCRRCSQLETCALIVLTFSCARRWRRGKQTRQTTSARIKEIDSAWRSMFFDWFSVVPVVWGWIYWHEFHYSLLVNKGQSAYICRSLPSLPLETFWSTRKMFREFIKWPNQAKWIIPALLLQKTTISNNINRIFLV